MTRGFDCSCKRKGHRARWMPTCFTTKSGPSSHIPNSMSGGMTVYEIGLPVSRIFHNNCKPLSFLRMSQKLLNVVWMSKLLLRYHPWTKYGGQCAKGRRASRTLCKIYHGHWRRHVYEDTPHGGSFKIPIKRLLVHRCMKVPKWKMCLTLGSLQELSNSQKEYFEQLKKQ